MRRAMRSRFCSSVSSIGLGFAHGAALDFLLVVGALEDDVNEDAGGMDLVRWKLPELDELFDFGDYVVGGGGHHGVEVARGLAIDEIAPAVALPGFDEGEIAAQGSFKDVLTPAEFAGFLAFGNHRAVAGGCVKRGNACSPGADALREGALRVQLDLHFAA